MSGLFKSGGAGHSVASPVPESKSEKPAEKAAGTGSAEDRAARRRARRGGRALLSDSRLNPEEGVSTLGSQGL